jgi:C4-dicarboxylate-binding protein DctP
MSIHRNVYLIVTAVALVFILASGSSSAQPMTINVGYASAEGSPYAVLADKFKELAEKYSNGSLQIKVRGAAQLATEDEAF